MDGSSPRVSSADLRRLPCRYRDCPGDRGEQPQQRQPCPDNTEFDYRNLVLKNLALDLLDDPLLPDHLKALQDPIREKKGGVTSLFMT